MVVSGSKLELVAVDGHDLQLSAQGLPSWLRFDKAARALKGTPEPSDVYKPANTLSISAINSAGLAAVQKVQLIVSPTHTVRNRQTRGARKHNATGCLHLQLNGRSL